MTALFPLKNEMYSKGIFFDGQKGGVFIYNQIPVMNYPQYRRMRRMVHECCNYDGGNCILRFRLRSTGMESNSITNQKALLSKYAAEHGFRNPMFFVDDGFSGTNFQRPGFQEMMKSVEDYSISTLIVKDLSRLGREYSYMGRPQDFIFPASDVRFIAINDDVDSAKGENDFAVFKNVFNDYYAKDTSKKIRAVVKMRGEAGEHIASNPPYGYPLQEYWSGRNIPAVPSILRLIQNLSNSRSGWKTQKKTSGYLKIRSRQSLNGDSGNGCRR